ncbi:MAG TPA: hypothetical protein VHK89_10655, partial [Actinomycetota bacterium]|nr:hypothetical protein [Actinomycetota bacterium]
GAGARRRRRAARRRLVDAVAAVAEERVLAPVAGELEAHERFCAALRRASDGSRRRSRRTRREVVAT